jgi:hypothetical protein
LAATPPSRPPSNRPPFEGGADGPTSLYYAGTPLPVPLQSTSNSYPYLSKPLPILPGPQLLLTMSHDQVPRKCEQPEGAGVVEKLPTFWRTQQCSR